MGEVHLAASAGRREWQYYYVRSSSSYVWFNVRYRRQKTVENSNNKIINENKVE